MGGFKQLFLWPLLISLALPKFAMNNLFLEFLVSNAADLGVAPSGGEVMGALEAADSRVSLLIGVLVMLFSFIRFPEGDWALLKVFLDGLNTLLDGIFSLSSWVNLVSELILCFYAE